MKQRQIIWFLSVLVIVAFVWGFYEACDGDNAVVAVENSRERAFYDLVDSMEKLAVLSDKALVSTGDSGRVKLYSQMATEAYAAQENMAQLPLYHSALTRTEQLLNQFGDFSFSLLSGATRGEVLTDEQYKTITQLNEQVKVISTSLHELAREDEDFLSWDASNQAVKKGASGDLNAMGTANNAFYEVNSGLVETPALIYDGPFSDHLESKGPIELEGDETTHQQALDMAQKLLGDDLEYEVVARSGEAAGIAVLTVAVREGATEKGRLDVSRKGCYPVQYTSYGDVQSVSVDASQALDTATSFVQSMGYEDMEASYYLIDEQVLTANFLYRQDDILYYPDMVKVSIELGSGTVCGFDAINYLANHRERKSGGLEMTALGAAQYVTSKMKPSSIQKVVIPLANGEESRCFEFRFDGEEQSWLVYVNAETGAEDNILMLYTTKNGTFAL